MVQMQTYLKVADNTGAKELKCIRVWAAPARDTPTSVTSSSALRKKLPGGNVKKGEVVKAVIVRSKQGVRRADGSYIRFDDNAAVIIRPTKPQGYPYLWAVARELRDKDYTKILSLAPEVALRRF